LLESTVLSCSIGEIIQTVTGVVEGERVTHLKHPSFSFSKVCSELRRFGKHMKVLVVEVDA
jgi:hypothetical protein